MSIPISELAGTGVPRTISAFDPGRATGIAQARDGEFVVNQPRMIEDMPAFLAGFLPHQLPDLVVAESFVLRAYQAKQQAGSTMPSARVLGQLDLWCYEHSIPMAEIPPNAKRAGQRYAERYLPGLVEVRAHARSEHGRDACDLLSFAVRTLAIGAR